MFAVRRRLSRGRDLRGSLREHGRKRFSPGERFASTYEINMLRCIYCGFCEDACPTEAIVLGDNYELSFYDRRSAIYTKEMLLEPVPVEHDHAAQCGARRIHALGPRNEGPAGLERNDVP
jgi:formate hydrogenlyase subunit 6/NADH:ubiquinone oxidoreductase subunit I